MSESEYQDVSVQEGYALWSESYDHEKNGLIFIEECHTSQMLSRLSFDTVLDVGTGTGRHALKLARLGANVTAIDQSPEMLAVASQVARHEGLSIDLRLASLDSDLPFKDQQFDLLISALMLSHVNDLSHAVREFARVLQDGGYLLISDFHPVHRIYGWNTIFIREGMKYCVPTAGHTKDDYLETIKANGLTLLEVKDIPMREVPDGYLPEEMARMYADKPFCLVILARK